MAIRYDAGILHKAEPTPQGGVRVPAFPTRVGVFTYRFPDGTVRRELRPPEEVFHVDSLASLRGAPVTDLHPEKDGERIAVTADNWRELAVGHAAENVQAQDPFVSADLLIQDRRMTDLINAGARKELSCGYGCDFDHTPGVWPPSGEVYDVIQRKIRYNHIALGPENWGRAGSRVALRLDSGDGIQVPGEDKTVETEIIDGVTYKVGTPEHLAALRKARDGALGRADASEKLVKGFQEKEAKAVTDTKTRTDAAEFTKAVQRRSQLLVLCDRVARAKGLEFRADAPEVAAATDGDLVTRLIKLLDPGFDVEGKSPDYLAGALETMIKSMQSAAGTTAETETSVTDPAAVDAKATPGAPPIQPKTDSKTGGGDIFKAREGQGPANKGSSQGQDAARYDSDSARSDMLKKNSEAHKGKLAFTK